jgi:hypothetical protein
MTVISAKEGKRWSRKNEHVSLPLLWNPDNNLHVQIRKLSLRDSIYIFQVCTSQIIGRTGILTHDWIFSNSVFSPCPNCLLTVSFQNLRTITWISLIKCPCLVPHVNIHYAFIRSYIKLQSSEEKVYGRDVI